MVVIHGATRRWERKLVMFTAALLRRIQLSDKKEARYTLSQLCSFLFTPQEHLNQPNQNHRRPPYSWRDRERAPHVRYIAILNVL